VEIATKTKQLALLIKKNAMVKQALVSQACNVERSMATAKRGLK